MPTECQKKECLTSSLMHTNNVYDMLEERCRFILSYYSETPVARTPLEPRKYVRDRGKKVKISHSLIAVGAVGFRVPLYLGHN